MISCPYCKITEKVVSIGFSAGLLVKTAECGHLITIREELPAITELEKWAAEGYPTWTERNDPKTIEV